MLFLPPALTFAIPSHHYHHYLIFLLKFQQLQSKCFQYRSKPRIIAMLAPCKGGIFFYAPSDKKIKPFVRRISYEQKDSQAQKGTDPS